MGDDAPRHGPGLLTSMWRNRYIVAAATVLAGVGGYLLAEQRPPVYETTARIYLTDPRSSGLLERVSVDPSRYVPQQAQRVESTPVLERVIAALDDPSATVPGLRRRLKVDGDIDLNLIDVTATSVNPERAALLADTAALAYRDSAGEVKLEAAQRASTELLDAAELIDEQIQELTSRLAGLDPDTDAAQVEALNGQIQRLVAQQVDLSGQAQRLLVDARVYGSGVELIETASIPEDPKAPKPLQDGSVLAVLALALASAWAYWREGRRDAITDKREPEKILGAPLLGTIPMMLGRRAVSLEERLDIPAPLQEAYQLLLGSIMHECAKRDRRVIVLTSAQSGDGKTEVALQLSVAAVIDRHSPVLIDGDLRVRRLTELTDTALLPGIVDLGENGGKWSSLVREIPVLDRSFWIPFIPAGADSYRKTSVVKDRMWAAHLAGFVNEVELGIFDSAPILAAADTGSLITKVGAVVLVVREGVKRSVLEEVRQRLSFTNAELLGYVYIGRDPVAAATMGYGEYAYRRTRDEIEIPLESGGAGGITEPVVPRRDGS